MHEVPPDGKIYLNFNTDIIFDNIKDKFEISPAGAYTIEGYEPFLPRMNSYIQECLGNTRCVIVRPTSLQSEQEHTLVLPAGTTVGRYSKPLDKDLSVAYVSLHQHRWGSHF